MVYRKNHETNNITTNNTTKTKQGQIQNEFKEKNHSTQTKNPSMVYRTNHEPNNITTNNTTKTKQGQIQNKEKTVKTNHHRIY